MSVQILHQTPCRLGLTAAMMALLCASTSLAQDGSGLLAQNSLRSHHPILTMQERPAFPSSQVIKDLGETDNRLVRLTPFEGGSSRPHAMQKDAALKVGKAQNKNIDVSALYYYAKQGEHARVDAEIARLKTIYSDFDVPADLYAQTHDHIPDETHLWALFARDDFSAIDAEFARLKSEDPNWRPTDDFSHKLARKRQRIQIKQLASLQDWAGVVALAQNIDPAVESDVDLVWTLIDAQAHLGAQDQLMRAYQGLLSRDLHTRLTDQELIATLQRAVRDVPAVEIRRAMMALWPNANELAHEIDGLDALKLSLARKAVADFNQNDDLSVPQLALEVNRLKKSAHLAQTSGQNTADLSLLGWYFLKVEDYDAALSYFETLMAEDANRDHADAEHAIANQAITDLARSDHAKGNYLALARKGLSRKAFQFAHDHLELLGDDPVFLMNVLSQKLSDPQKNAINQDILKAYSEAILATKSADHAQILGWYAYNARQYEAAQAWFETSLDWDATRDSVKGLALSHVQMGHQDAYQALKFDYEDMFPKVWSELAGVNMSGSASGRTAPKAKVQKASLTLTTKKVKKSVGASYLTHYRNKDYRSCLADLQQKAKTGLSTDASLIQGWCYLAMSRITDAQMSFGRAMKGQGQVRQDAIYGKALSLLRVHQTDDAEALIRTYPLKQARQNELLLDIYFQRARSAFDQKNFQQVLHSLDARQKISQEPRDLTLLRAWSLHNLGEKRQANVLFKRLNAHIHGPNASFGALMTNG